MVRRDLNPWVLPQRPQPARLQFRHPGVLSVPSAREALTDTFAGRTVGISSARCGRTIVSRNFPRRCKRYSRLWGKEAPSGGEMAEIPAPGRRGLALGI